MKRFAQLFRELDQTTRTSEKVAALKSYFTEAPPKDAVWVLHFLMGKRGKRPIKTTHMRSWVAEATGYPEWMVEECYDTVGDLAETLSLLMNAADGGPPSGSDESIPFAQLIETRIIPLSDASESDQRELFVSTLRSLEQTECFLFLKLLTGGFRMGVSKTLVIRALAGSAGLSSAVMQHRLMGKWEPTAEDFRRLLNVGQSGRDPAQPYPFYLASPIEQNTAPITDPSAWQAEWKWDGIRAQLIRRASQTILWSRGEEIITPGYPEIELTSRALQDGTVLDGELLAWRNGRPLSFNELQKRLGRKTVSRKVQMATPVVFMAYDILEHNGEDQRKHPLSSRRGLLETVISEAGEQFSELAQELFPPEEMQGELFALDSNGALVEVSENEPSGKTGGAPLTLNPSPRGEGGTGEADELEGRHFRRPVGARGDRSVAVLIPGTKADSPISHTPARVSPKETFALMLSPSIRAETMDELAARQKCAREMHAEGLMLKRLSSVYGVGRERGVWWKWKVDPYTIDAVMIAAQPGHGRRAGLFTDYTFGIWKDGELLSFAKAYSGLTDAEIQEIDKWVRAHTIGRHGPVRTVKPELVFELAFEGIQESKRHKSGLALRFPRIARWRKDKPAVEADRMEALHALLGNTCG